ncbi:transmembrane protein 87A-like isoform X2 [Xenia sp. Carnegie-2017]|nr:transmembrane protein 87A-like isoform X2 [Xenia sp. Carnegie-2017]
MYTSGARDRLIRYKEGVIKFHGKHLDGEINLARELDEKTQESVNDVKVKEELDSKKKADDGKKDEKNTRQKRETRQTRKVDEKARKSANNKKEKKRVDPKKKSNARNRVEKTKETAKGKKKVDPKKAGESTVDALDGNYLLLIQLDGVFPENGINVQVKVSIKMKTGYLSAAEWPLLPFYGAMSLVYLVYGVVWLAVSACQWRELLRIQFWIGGVIALGMLEKAILFSEYNNVNDTGVPAHGLVVLALVLSCIKRTLSRVLILIVSMGFGIVKPRLGNALHRILAVSSLYFVLSLVEGSYRELSVQVDVNRKQMIASIPLSVLDAVICWWIFMSLLQTMRTLRIRKNVIKLSLYRHFTNILAVAVLASVGFMVWVIKTHSFAVCIEDWKEVWIDDAFWHFLFALVLLAIMVLWRPTANNQRYAFTPLVDVGEDDEDDDITLSDAFQGMKMRNKNDGESVPPGEKQRKKAEDDLKWVEENIPTSGGIDTALPSLLDSDEEMMTTKLEMNKME